MHRRYGSWLKDSRLLKCQAGKIGRFLSLAKISVDENRSLAALGEDRRRRFDDARGKKGRFCLHVGVVWTRPAFGRHPVDILAWVFDITGLTMHAVLRVDLQH